MVAAMPEKCFEAKHLTKPLSFGPVFEAPLVYRIQDGTRSRAAVRKQDLFDARLKGSVLDQIALSQFIE